MAEAVLSVLLKTPVATGTDPNYRSLIPLAAVQQIRQSEKGVVLVGRDGREILLQGVWMDYYNALAGATGGATLVKVAPGPS